jgi:signal recognition particle GTPase
MISPILFENLGSKSARFVNELMKRTAAKLLAVNDSASGANAASWFFVFRQAATLETIVRMKLEGQAAQCTSLRSNCECWKIPG